MDQKSTGERIVDFWNNQAEWSRATFGSDQERGPEGPLKHLAKEVQECLDSPYDSMEYADMLFLIFDASRRSGITLEKLINDAEIKLSINKARKWNKPTTSEPVEHVRE